MTLLGYFIFNFNNLYVKTVDNKGNIVSIFVSEILFFHLKTLVLGLGAK